MPHYQLNHNTHGKIKKVFESEYAAMRHITFDKKTFSSFVEVQERFKIFQNLGWQLLEVEVAESKQ